MDITRKMTVLKLIYDNKEILFGKFDDILTYDMKQAKWQDIANKLNEMGIYSKDGQYLRNTTWQNWRKRTMEKKDNRQKTGSGGGKKMKLDEADDMILNIIGKDSPVVEGLNVPESSGTQEIIVVEPSQDIFNEPPPQELRKTTGYNKSILRLKKEKLEAEVLYLKEKTEIAKREKYKLDLELLKLERELNINKVSSYTEPFQNSNIIQINLVDIAGNEQANEISRADTM